MGPRRTAHLAAKSIALDRRLHGGAPPPTRRSLRSRGFIACAIAVLRIDAFTAGSPSRNRTLGALTEQARRSLRMLDRLVPVVSCQQRAFQHVARGLRGDGWLGTVDAWSTVDARCIWEIAARPVASAQLVHRFAARPPGGPPGLDALPEPPFVGGR
ncbi:MAG TPA: hypothetical protein VFT22_38845 [Kofleriaceae bacterium]|nr:hypothetical protein [Kofleriaceae bacterium]